MINEAHEILQKNFQNVRLLHKIRSSGAYVYDERAFALFFVLFVADCAGPGCICGRFGSESVTVIYSNSLATPR